MKAVARRHHYLPQCYLRGFAKPRKRGSSHHVHVFDRSGNTFSSNIINVAVEKDFNRIELEGHSPDAFESGIAKFEGELGPALIRILETQSIRNEEDRIYLFNLIGIAATRNPKHRETFREFRERMAYAVWDIATATKERWEGQMRQMKADGYSLNQNVTYEQIRKSVTDRGFRIELPNEEHIALEMHTLDTVLKTLIKRNWVVLLPPERSSGFITCDHPVCLMFSDPNRRRGSRGPGHGLAGTELIFPIGRRMAIIGSYELDEGTHELDEYGVASVNGAIISFAHRQVYAADPAFSYVRRSTEKMRKGLSLGKDALFLKSSR